MPPLTGFAPAGSVVGGGFVPPSPTSGFILSLCRSMAAILFVYTAQAVRTVAAAKMTTSVIAHIQMFFRSAGVMMSLLSTCPFCSSLIKKPSQRRDTNAILWIVTVLHIDFSLTRLAHTKFYPSCVSQMLPNAKPPNFVFYRIAIFLYRIFILYFLVASQCFIEFRLISLPIKNSV